MAEPPDVQRIRDAYAAFMAATSAALKDVAPYGVFHFNGEGPNSGAEAISAALVSLFELTGGTQVLDIKSVFADDRHGVVVLRETATRTDGVKLDIDEVHVLALDGEGRITDLWDFAPIPRCTTGSSTAGSRPRHCRRCCRERRLRNGADRLLHA